MKILELQEAEEEINAARERLAPLLREIHRAKAKAERLEHEYAMKIQPYNNAVQQATARQQRTLTPWTSEKGSKTYCSRHILKENPDKCWDNRAWLRMAGFAEMQWVLDSGNHDGDYRTLKGEGRKIIGPKDMPWQEAHAKADAYLIFRGYFLTYEGQFEDFVRAVLPAAVLPANSCG